MTARSIASPRRKVNAPLVQLDPVKPEKATREAMEDWRYREAMGYEFRVGLLSVAAETGNGEC